MDLKAAIFRHNFREFCRIKCNVLLLKSDFRKFGVTLALLFEQFFFSNPNLQLCIMLQISASFPELLFYAPNKSATMPDTYCSKKSAIGGRCIDSLKNSYACCFCYY